jgi:Tn3 transposase DDE domain
LGVGLGAVELPAEVPQRRLVDLARYGMGATATTLRRHRPSRQLATLLATVVYLEGKSVDDCLDLLDLLMMTELIGKAETATGKERARQHPKLARHSATLAAAVETLFEITEYGEEISLEQVWESIDAIVPRRELKTAVAAVTEMVPPPEADDDGPVRALLAERIATVSGFLKTLTTVIELGATAAADRVLEATKALPRLLDGRKKKVTEADIDTGLVSGSWKRLVHRPGAHGSTIDKNAYTMCVLTQFHRHLKRRDIYAQASARWRDPRAQLLAGDILRVAVSIYTGQVRAHDVMKMLQRDGNPTQLGEAIAHYGRIFKTLHILTYAIEEPYRRDIKGVRNLQESRHALAGKVLGAADAVLACPGRRWRLRRWRSGGGSIAARIRGAWAACP